MNAQKLTYMIALGVALMFAGCSKESDSPSGNTAYEGAKMLTDKGDQEFIDETIDRLPSIAIYNETIDKYILLDLSNAKNGFDFASPSGGFSFSSAGGGLEFVQGPDGGYFQIVEPGAGGSGGAGGVVTAGDVALSVSYVVCFNSGDETEGIDLFGVGDDFSGFSGAVGIAGNFEALTEMSESEIEELDVFEIFQGFVAYYAFDGTADGPYEVLNFFDASEEGEDFLEGKGLAYLISFQDDGGIFFSVDGEVEFNGNSVGFSGTYWGITDFEISLGGGAETEEDESAYVEVEGFGTLTCQ
jgi:hypothetical protein